jgi:hypothetical protein
VTLRAMLQRPGQMQELPSVGKFHHDVNPSISFTVFMERRVW